MRSGKGLKTAFALISLMGTLLTSIELAMQLFHTSICHTEGCKLVAQHVRSGDWIILAAGAFVFALLFIYSVIDLTLNQAESKKAVNTAIDFILIISLAAEGFFAGYQAFRLHEPCAFCLAIFGIFIALGILRILAGHKQVFTGFACFACIFSLFYLILPATSSTCLPQDKQLILFYEQGCPHCKDVLKECRQCNIQVYALSARKYQTLLKGLGIKEIPVLIVNDRGEKKILVGENKIRQYLHSLAVKKDILNLKGFSGLPVLPSNADACKIGGTGCD